MDEKTEIKKEDLRYLMETRRDDLRRYVGVPQASLFFKFLLSLKSTNTRRAYFRDLLHFFRFLKVQKAGKEIAQVSRADIDHFKEVLRRYGPEGRRPSSSATIKRKLASVSKFYKFLICENVLTKNPVEYVERPKVPLEVKAEVFSSEELKKMLSLFQKPTKANALKKALLLLQVSTGLRIGEILSLKLADYIREDQRYFIKVKSSKNAREWTKELSSRVGQALEDYLLFRDDLEPWLPLFSSLQKEGTPLRQGSAYDFIKRAALAIGIKRKISNHSARAYFITQSLDHVSLGEVQAEVGHSSIVMTNEYDKRRRENSEKLGSLIVDDIVP